jgi:hypothetical protein
MTYADYIHLQTNVSREYEAGIESRVQEHGTRGAYLGFLVRLDLDESMRDTNTHRTTDDGLLAIMAGGLIHHAYAGDDESANDILSTLNGFTNADVAALLKILAYEASKPVPEYLEKEK